MLSTLISDLLPPESRRNEFLLSHPVHGILLWQLKMTKTISYTAYITIQIYHVYLFSRSTLNIHWKDSCWSWSSNTPAIWCEEPTHWKIPWCWERLQAGGEAGNRGWDGWMASPTQCTLVWVNSRSWWWTGKPGMLQSMGSQSWTWLSNWTELKSEVWIISYH